MCKQTVWHRQGVFSKKDDQDAQVCMCTGASFTDWGKFEQELQLTMVDNCWVSFAQIVSRQLGLFKAYD